MDMGAGGTSSGAHQRHDLPLLDCLAFLDQDARTMTVAGGIAVTMINLDHVPITETAVSPCYNASGYGDNFGAFLRSYIDPFMQLPAAVKRIITVAIVGRYPAFNNRPPCRMDFLMQIA